MTRILALALAAAAFVLASCESTKSQKSDSCCASGSGGSCCAEAGKAGHKH